MSIIYDESSVNTCSFKGSIMDMNPHKPYKTHMENLYYLDFIAKNSKNFTECRQAERELLIAERKIKFWEGHPAMNPQEKERIINEVKKKWNKT